MRSEKLFSRFPPSRIFTKKKTFERKRHNSDHYIRLSNDKKNIPPGIVPGRRDQYSNKCFLNKGEMNENNVLVNAIFLKISIFIKSTKSFLKIIFLVKNVNPCQILKCINVVELSSVPLIIIGCIQCYELFS